MAKPTSAELNAINTQIKTQPWYQAWLQKYRLDPAHVTLSDWQRQDLTQEMARNGMPLPSDALVDKAGNVNTHHGFAGQPKWVKALEIGAAIAAGGYFLGPSIAGHLGGGAPAVGTLGGIAAPTTAATTASTAATTAGTLGSIAGGSSLMKYVPQIIGVGTNLYATHEATKANTQAMSAQEKAASDALAYTKERDALQLAEDQKVRDLNLGLFREREARLQPYRQFGAGSISQLGRPIPGTLGAMAGGR